MVWGAIAAAGIGLVGGIVKGNQQRSRADAQNKENKKIVKAQYERDLEEWELNYLQAQSDYSWNLANTEAQRYQDRVRQTDYEDQQSRVIDAALINLKLNGEALKDQYLTSEQLRLTQEANALRDGISNEQLKLDEALSGFNTAALESRLRTNDAIAGYFNAVQQNYIQANELVARKDAEGQNIQEQIVIEEQLDTLRRDAEYVAALVEGADIRAGVTARQGGSNSSRAVAMNSMKQFGRSYSLLKTEQKKRRNALNNYNASLAGETSSQLARIATAIGNEAQSIKYSRASNRLTLADLSSRSQLARAAYDQNTSSLVRNFNELTLPSFALTQRQGQREYQALISDTINTVKAASTPYREAIIFDPLEPIAGLKPEKAKVTQVAKPSWGSILLGAGVQAAQGALGMSYTKSNGSLGFR